VFDWLIVVAGVSSIFVAWGLLFYIGSIIMGDKEGAGETAMWGVGNAAFVPIVAVVGWLLHKVMI